MAPFVSKLLSPPPPHAAVSFPEQHNSGIAQSKSARASNRGAWHDAELTLRGCVYCVLDPKLTRSGCVLDAGRAAADDARARAAARPTMPEPARWQTMWLELEPGTAEAGAVVVWGHGQG